MDSTEQDKQAATTDRDTQVSQRFFERPTPEGYAELWTELLAQAKADHSEQGDSIFIFRLGEEWLALPTALLKQVAEPQKPHRIPHHAGVMRGLVNFEGELHLCVSMENLLQLDSETTMANAADVAMRRMVVIEREKQAWAFDVSEIFGVVKVPTEKIQDMPVTLSKSPTMHACGIISHEDMQVTLLDEALLFGALERSVA